MENTAEQIMQQACRTFWACRSIFRKLWGLKVFPQIYTMAVRLIITLCCSRSELQTSRALLSKL